MAVEIASGYVSLVPSFRGGQRRITQELSGISEGAGRRAGSRFGTVFASASLRPLRAFGAAAVGIFAGQQVVNFFREAVSGASDLQEAGTAIGQIFGSDARAIQQFAANANTALGQTRLQALNGAKTFGVFGQSAGLAGSELVGFSTELVTLATDLASFHNTSPEEAITAIGAALRGESEPIRQFGVLLDDATLRQRALALGLTDTTKKALTPQQRVLAAHAEILAQTNVAQGDFARTSDGLANQQRILSAQWTDLKSTLGGAFLPVATAVVSKFNEWLPALTPLVAKFEEWMPVLGDVADTVKSVLGPALSEARDFVTGLFDSIGGSGAVESFRTAFSSVGDTLGTFLPTLQELGRNVLSVLGPALSTIGTILLGQVIPSFARFFEAARPVLSWLLDTLGGALVGVLSGAATIIQGALTAISGILDTFAAIFTGDWSAAWEGVKKIAEGIWQIIQGAFQVFINGGIVKLLRMGVGLIRTIWSGVWNWVRGVFDSARKKLVDAVRAGVTAVVQWFRELPGRILRAIGNLASTLFRRGRDLLTGFRNGAVDMAGRVLSWFGGLPRRILNAVGNLGRVLYGAGRAILEGLLRGLRSAWDSVAGWLGDVGGWIADIKGPRSYDLRILRPAGNWIMQGLQAGLEDQIPSLRRQLGVITGIVAEPMTAPDIRTMAGAIGPTQGSNEVQIVADGLDRALLEWLRRAIRVQGGNVQTALGTSGR